MMRRIDVRQLQHLHDRITSKNRFDVLKSRRASLVTLHIETR